MKFTLNISATPPSLDNINNVIKQAFKINVCLWFVASKCQEELNAFSLVDVRFVALEVTATGAQTFLRVLVLHFELLGISVPETLAFSVFPSWIPVPKLNNTRNVQKIWVSCFACKRYKIEERIFSVCNLWVLYVLGISNKCSVSWVFFFFFFYQ